MKFHSISLAISLSLALATSLYGQVDAKKVTKAKVAILGGGVSAINAARHLTDAGIDDFVIIEARDILGGRAQDVPFAGRRVEAGCNWVQGLGENPINQLRQKYNLTTSVTNGDSLAFYDENGRTDASETYEAYMAASDRMTELSFERIKNDQVDLSARAGLDLSGWFPKTAMEKAIEYYVFDWELGETPEVSSMQFSVENSNWTYTGFGPDSDGDLFVTDPRGFKHIFLEEANLFLKKDDSRVKLNTLVTKVEYNKRGVTIHTDNETFKADYAISTFSIGVLQNHDVEWSPALPAWKLEGIYGFHMATYTKIFLNFPHQFWDDEQFSVYADPDRRGYYAAWQNLNAPGFLPKGTDTNIFFVTVTQEQSYTVESMEDSEVQAEIMEVLKKMYGNDIPEPTEIFIPRWHSNPLFRGSYSNWPIGELEEHHVNMRAPINNRVFFAGEAMSEDYFGFLQGAWFSGAEVGDNVAQCIKGRCPPAPYYPEIHNAKLKSHFVRR
ncbi:amine oxidase [Phycomyces nitens]|nr:amine oxidase [Phycomyces nitens]